MGRFKSTETFKAGGLEFYAGLRRICINGTIPHGKGTREVRVDLRPDTLAEMARLAAFVCIEPDPSSHGHCLWHYQRPEREYPCDQCSDAVKAAKERWAKRIGPAGILATPAPAPATPPEGHSGGGDA